MWWRNSKRGSFEATIKCRTRYGRSLEVCSELQHFAVWHKTSCVMHFDKQHVKYLKMKQAAHCLLNTAWDKTKQMRSQQQHPLFKLYKLSGSTFQYLTNLQRRLEMICGQNLKTLAPSVGSQHEAVSPCWGAICIAEAEHT